MNVIYTVIAAICAACKNFNKVSRVKHWGPWLPWLLGLCTEHSLKMLPRRSSNAKINDKEDAFKNGKNVTENEDITVGSVNLLQFFQSYLHNYTLHTCTHCMGLCLLANN